MSQPQRHRLRVGLLGCGTVGGEVARQLIADPRFELAAVLVRDLGRDRGIPTHLLTASAQEIVSRELDVVVEAIGGLDPARMLVERSLGAGLHVVTANKSLIAWHGRELLLLAERRGTSLRFEAAVCSATPVLSALEHLKGDRVRSIRGIVNGTCNYVLTRMAEGLEFDEAIADARRKGFGEPDPSADISGRDSAEKLCVLALAAGLGSIAPAEFEWHGIDGITRHDLEEARRSRMTIRLLAELKREAQAMHLRVGPALVPMGSELASVSREANGILIRAELAGEIFLRGPGAGAQPTASAILGDLARLLPAPWLPPPQRPTPEYAPPDASRHVIRVQSDDVRPESVFRAVRLCGIDLCEARLGRGWAWLESTASFQAACHLGRIICQSRGKHAVLPILDTG